MMVPSGPETVIDLKETDLPPDGPTSIPVPDSSAASPGASPGPSPVRAPLPAKYDALRGRRILVTGAAGFIGGALFRRLAAAGLDVTGTAWHADEVARLRADGLRAERLDLFSDDGFAGAVAGMDMVFHVAAMFQETEYDEAAYLKVNRDGALRLARDAAAAGVRRFVHCSTVGVHGAVKEIPATETTPFNPMDEYHRTKLAGELAVLDWAKGLPPEEAPGGMTVVANRPAMVYGPGDMRMLKLFRQVLSGRFVMVGSGRTLAHLGHVDDQVTSFLDCAVASREAAHLEAFNIASGEPLSLNELVRIVAEEGGVAVPRLRVPVAPVWAAGAVCEALWAPFGARPPLFRRRVGFFTHDRAFDLTKARERLGYVSAVPHREGIRGTIAWYRAKGLVG